MMLVLNHQELAPGVIRTHNLLIRSQMVRLFTQTELMALGRTPIGRYLAGSLPRFTDLAQRFQQSDSFDGLALNRLNCVHSNTL
jgi:hypothetical protein